MQTKLVDVFTRATAGVFETYSGEKPIAGEAATLPENAVLDFDFTGVVGVAGEVRGLVAISFQRGEISRFLLARTAALPESMNGAIRDFLGEFVNVVTGNTKKDLGETISAFSLPRILEGRPHQPRWPGKEMEIVQIPFTTRTGLFALTLALKSSGAPTS